MFEIWGTFHLSTTRNPDQAISHVHIKVINSIIRTQKAAVTFSMSKLHLPTFSSLSNYYPTITKDLRRILTKLRTRQDESNNKKNYGSIDKWTLTG
jgi:hypothetical protein